MTRIAIVEDCDLVAEFLSDVFEGRGYDVTVCPTLQAAQQILETPPDLLVSDVRLPDGCGLELVARFQARHPGVPVLVVSGLSSEQDMLNGYESGASDYITKPIHRAELLAKCSVLLNRARRPHASGPVVRCGHELPGGPDRAFGRYKIESLLGQGGCGVVYAAIDVRSGKQVALKALALATNARPGAQERFLREAYAISLVKHPSVVSVIDFGASQGRLFYAMERVHGPTLAEAIAARGVASEAQVLEMVWALSGALVELGRADLVHRDIKPENIILRDGRFDRAVLVDFGLAKRPLDRSLTAPGMFVGTPDFTAPELITDRPIDARTDLFSLGLVARFALTGTPAFPECEGLSLLRAVVTDQVEFPVTLSPRAREILSALTRIQPAERTPSAKGLRRRLAPLVHPAREAA